jgi:hypothetical protein
MTAKIAAALHAVMQDVSYVQRTGQNKFHNYRYAGEADLLEKLRPALLRHGLLLIPSAQEASPADQHGNVTVRVEYTLVHKDGDVWPDKIGAVGCGNDRSKDGKIGDKGVYKALTGANKYLLFKLFQIETGDDPEKDDARTTDGSNGHEEASEPQEEVIKRHVRYIDKETSLPKLKAWWEREKHGFSEAGIYKDLHPVFLERGYKLSASSVIKGPEAA